VNRKGIPCGAQRMGKLIRRTITLSLSRPEGLDAVSEGGGTYNNRETRQQCSVSW